MKTQAATVTADRLRSFLERIERLLEERKAIQDDIRDIFSEPKDGGSISGKKPPKGGGLIIRLGKWQQLAPRDVDAVKVDSEIHDDALTIRLPEHARMAPPAPRPAAVAAPAPVAAPAKKVSVNDRFFDDPKPRVAMASGTRK